MTSDRRLPYKIEKCPIKEAIFELRFEPTVPGAAVFGIIYNGLKKTYPSFEQLPILQLPDVLRDKDPNLMFHPHYRLRQDNLLVQVGPKMLSVNILEPYTGWTDFRTRILEVLISVRDLNLIEDVIRLGLRYTNLFQDSILEKIKVKLFLDKQQIVNPETSIRTVFDEGGGFKTILQIAADLNVTPTSGEAFIGSLIDVDVGISEADIKLDNIEELIDRAHDIEKGKFFSLLTDEFIEMLEPTYAESH